MLPILLAALIAAAVLIALWWQVFQGKLAVQRILSIRSTQDVFLDATLPLPGDLSEIDSGDAALLHLRRGDILMLQGQFTAAQEEFEEAVQNDGGLPALRKLAQVQLQRRDLDGVTETLEELKRAGARSEDVLLFETVVLLQRAELQQARTLLDAATDSPHKHYGLALMAIMEGRHDEAKTELALVENGWEPVLRTFARTLTAAYNEYALFPESPEIHRQALLARALADVSQCELARPMLAQVLVQRDNYRDAWIVQGFCELVTERPKEALTSLERAYGIDPQKPEVQYFLARAYSAQNDHQNAVTFLQYALRNGFEPEEEVRLLLGREAALIGNTPLALEQFGALTSLSSATPETYSTFVRMAISLASQDAAVTKAQEATQKWPNDARSWELLGFASKEAGKKDEARQALQKALEIEPNRTSAKEMMEKL